MDTTLRLLCIVAHPDDESLGMGGILAHYASAGVATHLLMATRGERGWQGDPRDNPGPVALGQLREAELRAAAAVLRVRSVRFLDYHDGDLDQCDTAEALAAITAQIRLVRPQVVVTFAPDGSTGHPDHIAISQLTTGALICAADHSYHSSPQAPAHRVDKLYYLAGSHTQFAAYDAIFGDSAMTVDGVTRRFAGWEDWAITTRIDTSNHWQQVWQAISCHRSQLPGYAALAQLPDAQQRALWGVQEFYRAFSLVNGGRALEDDLFAGIA